MAAASSRGAAKPDARVQKFVQDREVDGLMKWIVSESGAEKRDQFVAFLRELIGRDKKVAPHEVATCYLAFVDKLSAKECVANLRTIRAVQKRGTGKLR